MDFKSHCLLFLTLTIPFGLRSQEVYTAGAAKDVMTGADLSVHVHLDSLMQYPGLVAVGPLENLRGEITVLDGKTAVSTVEKGRIATVQNTDSKAPFLAYAYVDAWEFKAVSVHLDGLKSIEALIDSLALGAGFAADEAFPFVLSGRWSRADYHIIMRDTTEEVHSHEAHSRAKIKFSEGDIDAELVGFFSRNHEGIFTHKGQYVHVHFLTADRKRTGHLDEIMHKGEITVGLPKRNR